MCRKPHSVDVHHFGGYVLLMILFLNFTAAYSQQTIVRGKVTDIDNGRPVPFVSVGFKNTKIGALTDTLGNYQLTTREKVDSIRFSAIGYFSRTFAFKTGAKTELPVSLKSVVVNLSEIRILADDGPVRRILKKMVEAKKRNNPAKYERDSYRKYTKWEYHLNNVGKKMMESWAFRNDQSVFKTDSNNTRYLPVYFSEQLVYNEFQRNPLKQKSTVLADKTSGVGMLEKFEVTGYTSALDIEVNFYDNFIKLFSQNFVSPLADNGWFYYKYFLADSSFVNGRKYYRIEFQPRRSGDKAFKGFMTTETMHYSLAELDGTLSSTSYLNFLKSMRLKSSYQFVDESTPFFKKNQIEAVFNYVPLRNNPTKKPISLFFTQTAIIDSVTVNQPRDVRLTHQ